MNFSNFRYRRIFVTGGAGFIGSCLVRHLIMNSNYDVLVYDKLTYASTLASLEIVLKDSRLNFIQGDICDAVSVSKALSEFDPDVIVNLAAETHVDRSIDHPEIFIETNIIGTMVLLQLSTSHWKSLSSERSKLFRFHHVSTDEVFGSLSDTGFFDEASKYDPRSPYSASKAGSDHLVRAWHHTYGLPITISNCSNNFGAFQFPEKLISLIIIRALSGEDLPVYGRGENIRDWIFVDDHVRAIQLVFERGTLGSTYLIGANEEHKNIDVVNSICKILDRIKPRSDKKSYTEQICFVADRPGHDYRYSIKSEKIKRDIGWIPEVSFQDGLEKTIKWYLDNENWWRPLVERKNSSIRRGLSSS